MYSLSHDSVLVCLCDLYTDCTFSTRRMFMAASSTARYRKTQGRARTRMPFRESQCRQCTFRSVVALVCSVMGARRLPQPLQTYLRTIEVRRAREETNRMSAYALW